MASSSFRESMNSMGWNRAFNNTISTAQDQSLLGKLSSYNPFRSEGYVSLPTQEPGAPLPAPSRREEEEAFFALSRWDRLLIFGGLNLAAGVCFVICFFLSFFFVATMQFRKFAILWTMGSVFFLASWAVLMGPMTYARHLTSGPRLPFTGVYFSSIALTLYFAVGLKNPILTIIASIVQLIALLWYVVSYFPMGSTGLRFAASFGTSRVAAWMSG